MDCVHKRTKDSVANLTSWNWRLVVLRLTPMVHSALYLTGLKNILFEPRLGWGTPE